LSSAIGVIQGGHLIIAQLRNEGHWLISDDDAKRYGQAMANAARHFPLKTTQKAIDVGAFIMAAFIIESPRVIRSVQLARAPKGPQRGPAQVFQFVHPQPQPQPQPQPVQPASPPQSPAASATSPTDGGGTPPIAEGPPDDLNAFGGEI